MELLFAEVLWPVVFTQAARAELIDAQEFEYAECLARISHGPVRNAHGVPIRHWRIGASREGFRPGKLLSKQLATGDLLTS